MNKETTRFHLVIRQAFIIQQIRATYFEIENNQKYGINYYYNVARSHHKHNYGLSHSSMKSRMFEMLNINLRLLNTFHGIM